MKNQQQTTTISGKLYFDGVPAQRLYLSYMNARVHTEFTKQPTVVNEEAGSDFSALNNNIYGKTLYAVPFKRIVQLIKTKHYGLKQDYSVLMFTYTELNGSCLMQYTIANVPTEKEEQVLHLFTKYYFNAWSKHFNRKPRKNAKQIMFEEI